MNGAPSHQGLLLQDVLQKRIITAVSHHEVQQCRPLGIYQREETQPILNWTGSIPRCDLRSPEFYNLNFFQHSPQRIQPCRPGDRQHSHKKCRSLWPCTLSVRWQCFWCPVRGFWWGKCWWPSQKLRGTQRCSYVRIGHCQATGSELAGTTGRHSSLSSLPWRLNSSSWEGKDC